MIGLLKSGRSGWRDWSLLALLLMATAAWLAGGRWLWRLDQGLYDVGLALWERSAPQNVVIIAIDEASLDAVGRWPWRRAVLAALVDRLTEAGATAVGIDLLLSEESADDDVLAAALKRNLRCVLPAIAEPRGQAQRLQESLPVKSIADAAAGVGHVNIELDGDGIARGIFLREGPERPSREHFAMELLRVAEQRPASLPPHERAPPEQVPPPNSWRRDQHLLIPFIGPPGKFTRISAAALLRGDVAGASLAGRIALIGATAVGVGDAYPTPASGLARPMPGTELIANVIQALRNGEGIRTAPDWLQVVLASGGTALVLLMLRQSTPRRGLWLALAAAAGSIVASLLALRLAAWWLPPMAIVVPALAAYPLWSWRRLETTMRFVDAEIARLDQEPVLMPTTVRSRAGRPSDLIEVRLAVLRMAAERLRDAQRFIAETLESLPDGALVADIDGRVVLATRRATVDLGGEGAASCLIGGSLVELLGRLTPADGQSWASRVAAFTTAQEPLVCEARHRDGRDMIVKFAPYHANDQHTVGLIALLLDVTPLKEAERLRDQLQSMEALKAHDEEMRRLNQELEARVVARTKDLSDAMQELESFSYSVSHDLQAPVRATNGFAGMVLREYGDTVPPEARRMLERIAAAGRTMGAMIDGLLDLSKLAKANIQRQPVDLSALARTVWDDIVAGEPQRNVEILIEDGCAAIGDEALLRSALQNLLGNAFKFTRRTIAARVEFGCFEQDRERGWFVRDNGAGFDMRYASRLFGAFQRLHGADQFEGTGIGLATVQRIVQRHGGRIWAKSEPGKGATFLFTLRPAH